MAGEFDCPLRILKGFPASKVDSMVAIWGYCVDIHFFPRSASSFILESLQEIDNICWMHLLIDKIFWISKPHLLLIDKMLIALGNVATNWRDERREVDISPTPRCHYSGVSMGVYP